MINLPKSLKLIDNNEDKDTQLNMVYERLEKIRLYMEREIAFKQRLIEGQEEQIRELKSRLEEKDSSIRRLEGQLLECRQTNEGTRQLINKLLSDISNHQKDIEWYKRTYEKRSLLGTIRQKIFNK
jgi:septal ring factor EnvC (AmiA/AmiB activator)